MGRRVSLCIQVKRLSLEGPTDRQTAHGQTDGGTDRQGGTGQTDRYSYRETDRDTERDIH